MTDQLNQIFTALGNLNGTVTAILNEQKNSIDDRKDFQEKVMETFTEHTKILTLVPPHIQKDEENEELNDIRHKATENYISDQKTTYRNITFLARAAIVLAGIPMIGKIFTAIAAAAAK